MVRKAFSSKKLGCFPVNENSGKEYGCLYLISIDTVREGDFYIINERGKAVTLPCPVFTVEIAVIDSFGDVGGLYGFAAGQIGDGA